MYISVSESSDKTSLDNPFNTDNIIYDRDHDKQEETLTLETKFYNDKYFFDVDKIEVENFKRKLEFHGFLKVGWPINGNSKDGFDESSNIFDQTELTLWFGTDIFKNLSFTSEVEFDEGFEEFTFEKFEFNWDIYKDFAMVKFGKFIYPFGIERLVEDAPLNKFITRPTPFKQIIPGTYSDNGIELYGIFPLISKIQLKYELALTVGLSGPSRKGEQQLDENNDSRTLGGRLGFLLFPGFEIGTSYSTGKYDDSDRSRINFLGFDIALQKGGFELRGEYLRSNVDSSEKIADSFNREGYYGQLSYKYRPELNYLRFIEGVARFDSVDPNDLVTNENDTDRFSFGINYSPMEHIEFKFEFNLENEAAENRENNLLFQTIFTW